MYAFESDNNVDVFHEPDRTESSPLLRLTVIVTDPVARAELLARSEGRERSQFAATALSIGIMCLREAVARVDVESLQEAGRALLVEAQHLITARGSELVTQVSTMLKEHFDPNSGLLPTRLQALTQENGEIESLLSSYLSGDNSALATSLAQYVGKESALFKLLSPTEQEGLIAQIGRALECALIEQRSSILREFTLDNKDSALSRFLSEVALKQGALNQGLEGKIDEVVKEFSLDQPNSALSRLVGRVEHTQKAISEQFSADNDHLSGVKSFFRSTTIRTAA